MVVDDDWEEFLPYAWLIVGNIIWPFIWLNVWSFVWPIIWLFAWRIDVLGEFTHNTQDVSCRPWACPLDQISGLDPDRPESTQDTTRNNTSTVQYIAIGAISAVVLIVGIVLTGISFTRCPCSHEIRPGSMPRVSSSAVTPYATTSFTEPAEVVITVALVKN